MKPAKAGYYNGTFNISFPAAETDSSDSEAGESTEDDTDTSATDMLAGFGAVIKLTSDADADTSTLDLTGDNIWCSTGNIVYHRFLW